MTGCRFAGLIAILMSVSASVADELTPELSVKEIMNSIVTPATNTIWELISWKPNRSGRKWAGRRWRWSARPTC